MDKIIMCPKSGGDLCYETQVTPEITNWMSLSCGYWTNSLMTEESEFYNEQMASLPELYRDLAWKDESTKLVWLPQTINEPQKGMVFANGTNIQEWKWSAVKSKEGKPDMTTKKEFEERDFMEALDYVGYFNQK